MVTVSTCHVDTSFMITPFEYVNSDRCMLVRLRDIGNEQWEYTLRQILECERDDCRWNEVIDITIVMQMKDSRTAEALRGVRRVWDDINFHTTCKDRIVDKACRMSEQTYKKYLKSCHDVAVEHLLDSVEVLQNIRPEVDEVDMNVCKKVVHSLTEAFQGRR